MSNETVVKLKLDTKARLDKLKKERLTLTTQLASSRELESYNDVIERLLTFYEKHQGCMVFIEGG